MMEIAQKTVFSERIMNMKVASIEPVRLRVDTSVTKSVKVIQFARKKKNASSLK